jgi:hypothetical protein
MCLHATTLRMFFFGSRHVANVSKLSMMAFAQGLNDLAIVDSIITGVPGSLRLANSRMQVSSPAGLGVPCSWTL